MEHWISHVSPEAACKALSNVAGLHERLPGLAARPWNMYRPEESPWWLIPRDAEGSSPWPAHSVGKYYFCFSHDRKSVFIGLHVEKGLTSAAIATFPRGQAKAWEMTDDWAWWRVLTDLRSGKLERVAAEVATATGLPVRFRISGSPPVPVGDPRLPGDEFLFSCPEARLVPVDPPARTKSLPDLRRVESGEMLADALSSFPGDDFVWIDAMVGVEFPLGPAAGFSPGGEWTAERIWSDLLAPFAAWVR